MEGFKKICCLWLCAGLFSCNPALPEYTGVSSDGIRLNQLGYYPQATKRAILVDAVNTEFKVVDKNTMQEAFSGKLSEARDWELSGETVKVANFSALNKEGTYLLWSEGLGYSHPFEIGGNILEDVFLGSIKGLYYQRIGIPLKERHAGKWHRPMAHPDDSLLYHPSSGREKGYMASPGGWYDAGDYNKYIVNACFPLGQLYLLEEQYPEIIEDNALNIPESGNGASDFLDELKYEMDWALTMQDDDGGLFHKLTAKGFEGMVMPHEAQSQRYIVGKGTTATLDFAAAAAQAYRIFKDSEPEYAQKCLDAGKRAYDWAMK
ncbi:MAG: glycoside hydrolase family 9 protein, partial [Bacteroidota bacterium]